MKLITMRELHNRTETGLTLADMIAHIEENNVMTPDMDAQAMEFTGGGSWIVPVCVVHYEWLFGDYSVSAEAGPGQTLNFDTLLAYEIVAKQILNRAAAKASAKALTAYASKSYASDAAGMTAGLMEASV